MQAKPSARDFLKRGNAQFERNNFVKAITQYTKAIELDPNFAEAYVRRGMARRARGNLAGAIRDFEKAESIDSASIANNRYVADAYSNRGFIELAELEIDIAIADFTKAIKAFRDAKHYYRRGRAKLIDGDLDGAIEDFSVALDAKPEGDFLTMMIHANRGYAWLLKGNNTEAKTDFDECMNANHGLGPMLKWHLRTLESQMKERKRRRVKEMRTVS